MTASDRGLGDGAPPARDDRDFELQQVDTILDMAKAPTEEYAAQAGGMVTFTRAGRVDWLWRELARVQDELDQARLTHAQDTACMANVLGEAARLGGQLDQARAALKGLLAAIDDDVDRTTHPSGEALIRCLEAEDKARAALASGVTENGDDDV